MNFLFFLLFLCVAAAVYFLLSGLLRLPTLAGTRAVLRLTQKKKVRGAEAVRTRIAAGLAKHIHLDGYRRRTMTATLKYAGIDRTPEAYYADAAVRALFRLLPAVPCAFFFPLGIAVFALWALKGFFDGTRKAQDIVGKKREKIDGELYRFVSTLAQEFEASRDVLSILEGYLPSAGPLFQDELKITIAEMKSGSRVQALNHLAGRVGSELLSQVVRGLQNVLQGGDGATYFTMLAHDFHALEIQKIEKDSLRRPGKMKRYSYLLLGGFISLWMYAIFAQILGSANGLWG